MVLWMGMGFGLHYGIGSHIRTGQLAQGSRALLGMGLGYLLAQPSLKPARSMLGGLLLGEALFWLAGASRTLDRLRFYYYNEVCAALSFSFSIQ